MKKKNQPVKKLTLKKTQLTKVNNLIMIKGGSEATHQINQNTCGDPENGSKPAETILATTA